MKKEISMNQNYVKYDTIYIKSLDLIRFSEKTQVIKTFFIWWRTFN